MELLFQFLVLAFTVLVWWLARRDLSRRAAESRSPAMAEWERLRGNVDALIADLERRAAAAEQRITDAEQRLSGAEFRPLQRENAAPRIDANQAAHDLLYAPVYALLDIGVTDAAKIAQQTGLTRGEIELILDLRARQARL
jgi:hypothetical protein